MSNPATRNNERGRDHRRLLRQFLDGHGEGRQHSTTRRISINMTRTSPTRPSILEELKANDPAVRELQLSSTHALLDCESLLQAIRQNQTIQTVRVHGFFVEQLSSSHHQKKRLWKALGSLPQLKELHFNYFLGSSLTVEALNLVLGRAFGLAKLYLHDCKVSLGDTHGSRTDMSATKTSLVSLKQHTALRDVHITQLILSDDETTPAALDPLVQMLVSAPNLQMLTLRMAQPQSNLLSERTLDVLANNSGLRTLDLRHIVLDTSSMTRFMHQLTLTKESPSSSFQGNGRWVGSSMKDLVLETEQVLNQDACLAIAKVLQHNNALERVDLFGSQIDERGLVAMAQSLKQNCKIRVFHLSYKNITPKGQEVLIDMLRHNHYLESMVFPRSLENSTDFLPTVDFYLQMNTTHIRRLLLNVNVDRDQIFDKLVVHADKVDYLFHLLRGNPSFLTP